jgi:hypothetical protein
MQFPFLKRKPFPTEIAQRLRFSWILHFLFQFGWVISWIVVTALFVEKFGLQNLLFLFAIEAGVLLLSTIITHNFFSHISAKKIVNSSAIGIMLLLFGSFWASQAEHVYILFGLAILAKDALYPRLRMGLLRNTEELFTPSQAEKAIPFTETALTIGSLCGAFFLFILLKFLTDISTQTLLSLWIIPIICIFLLLSFESRILNEIPELSEEKKLYESHKSTFQNLRKTFQKVPFLRTLAIMILLQASIFTIIEYNTISKLEHSLDHSFTTTNISVSPEHLSASIFGNIKDSSNKFITVTNKEIKVFSSTLIAHNTLLHDLSALHVMVGILAVIMNFFITPWFLKKKGVIRSMLYYFVGFFLMLPIMFLGGSWPIVALRSYAHGFHSLFSASYHLTFYSAFEEQREFIRHIFEGIIVPLGVLLAVAILFLLQVLTLSILFPLVLCVIGITLILLSYRLIPKYTHCAIKNLSVAKNIREQLHAIEVLGQKGHCCEKTTKTLCHLLEKEETHRAIREKIIRTLQHIQSSDTLHDFSRILEKEHEPIELKVKILEAMLQFDSLREFGNSKMFAQHKLLRILNTLFETTNHEYLKKLIIMNIFSHLPADKVVPFFLKTMESNDEKLQSVCLRSCQMFNDPDIVSYIEPYLKHQNSRVRSHALISLWKFYDKETLQKNLLSFLNTDDSQNIISGIYAIGEIQDSENHSLLEPFLQHENKELRIHALIAQAKLGNAHCIPSLIEILFGEEDETAHKVFEMLKRRVPKDIRNEIIHQIKRHVAKQVWEIIGHHPKPSILQSLSHDRIRYLRRLYEFSGQHDDILILEQAIVANA